MREAVIPDMPDVRAPAARPNAGMIRDLEESFAQERRSDFPMAPDGTIHYAHLALSGGGPNGAFGAGFLNAWTQTGKRPVFKIVTGVSTGALMASFAFLGPQYDSALKDFYTTTASRNVFRVLRIIPQLLGGESLADTGPLRALIAQTVDETFLKKIAEAHAQGRRLYVGTVDLDSQRFIIWNMGLIAQKGTTEAVDLFRQVLLASSSIPVAFPPVYFDVEAGGRRYDEMHVDGSVAAFVFYSGGVFSFRDARVAAGRSLGTEEIYVIHKGQLLPRPEATSRSLRSIATRVFDSVGKSMVVGDLYRIWAVAVSESAAYHWVTIPDGVEITGNEVFDPEKMSELYDLGFQKALAGPAWRTLPPGLNSPAMGP